MPEMPRFFAIHEGYYSGVKERLESIALVCREFDVDFISLDANEVDYSSLPILNPDDCLYNVARGAEILETLLLQHNPRTYYVTNPLLIENNGDTTKYSIVHDQTDIPTPLTIFKCSRDKNQMKKYIDYLGGFPIVVKVSGGTKGVGTMKLNDFPSLFSVTDYLFECDTPFMLREYINPSEIARLIVVGSEVVYANEKLISKDDFRTSISDQLPIIKKYPAHIEVVSIQASHAANFDNCGVDVLIDDAGNPFILEVNMPHDFISYDMDQRLHIARCMVKHILTK